MSTQIPIILTLCFWLAFASAAVNLAQIVASNENLQEQSTNADSDVNSVTLVNGLDYAPVRFALDTRSPGKLINTLQKVTQDLAEINTALTDVVADAKQVTPTADSGSESSVTSSFSSVRKNNQLHNHQHELPQIIRMLTKPETKSSPTP